MKKRQPHFHAFSLGDFNGYFTLGSFHSINAGYPSLLPFFFLSYFVAAPTIIRALCLRYILNFWNVCRIMQTWRGMTARNRRRRRLPYCLPCCWSSGTRTIPRLFHVWNLVPALGTKSVRQRRRFHIPERRRHGALLRRRVLKWRLPLKFERNRNVIRMQKARKKQGLQFIFFNNCMV